MASDSDSPKNGSLEQQSLLPKGDNMNTPRRGSSSETPATAEASEYGTFENQHEEEREHESRNARRTEFGFAREDGNLAQRLLWRLFSPPAIPKDRAVADSSTASLLSRMLASWVFHLVWAATTRQLDINDVDRIDPRHKAGTKTEEFAAHLGHFASPSAKSRHPLIRALFSTFRRQFVFGLLLIASSMVMDALIIFSLRWLGMVLMHAYLHPEDHGTELVWKAVLLSFLVGSSNFARRLSECHTMLTMRLVGGECRTLLASCMYAKAMRISRTAVRPSAKETGGQDKSGLDVDEDEYDDELEDYEDCCSREPAVGTALKESSTGKWYSRIFGARSQGQKTRHANPHLYPHNRKQADTSQAASQTQQTKNASEVYWTEGPIINSMSVDTERIEAAVNKLHHLWTFPMAAPSRFLMAWYLFSWPGVVGCLVIITGLPVLWLMAATVSKKRVSVNRLSEQRANIVMDMIKGAQFLKLFGWEQVFLERFHRVRAKETKLLRLVQVSTVFLFMVTVALQRGTVVFSYTLYRYFVGDLSRAYDVLPFLLTLKELADYLGNLRFGLYHVVAWPSVKNVQDFLLAADEEPGQTYTRVQDPENAVELEAADFSWSGGASKAQDTDTNADADADAGSSAAHKLVANQNFRLHPLTLSIRRSELIAVVGPVACGKSSLASGLMGLMSHVGGRVGLDLSRVAYCAQSAWIENASVRENITFGHPMEQARYDRTIAACALDQEIAIEFSDGDATELGERGVTVSGGQKARIQLARTMYRQSDIVILDDPLAAVDAGTCRHIFKKVLLEELAGKCRILLTHQLHLLSQCDRVVWMEDGKIMAVDTYECLMAEHPTFAEWVGDVAALQNLSAEKQDEVGSSDPSNARAPKAAAMEEEAAVAMLLRSSTPSSVDGGAGPKALMVAEERAISDVPLSLYGRYLTLATPVSVIIVHYTAVSLSQAFNMIYHGSVSMWSARLWDLPDWAYPTVMAANMVLNMLLWGYFFVSIQADFILSSQAMVRGAIEKVFRAPMSFFNTNPLGRIMNRFTQDVSSMDTRLPVAAWEVSLCAVAMITQIVAIYIFMPLATVIFVPWFGGMCAILWLYKRSPLELERLEKLQQSHFVSKLAEGVDGRSSLVLFGRVAFFRQKLHDVIDELNSIHFSEFSAHAWVDIRSAFMASVLTVAVALLAVERRHHLHPSFTLWILIICPYFSEYMTAVLEMIADVQKGMTAVQRVNYYRTSLQDEGARHLAPSEDGAGARWPVDNSIEIRNVFMRYRPSLPLSIQGLDLIVRSGERVGIVGRTGSGKSSLMAILLRTVQVESGTVVISGVDTSQIGLHPLRRALAIIPQDPTLFLGTIRRNLDRTASDRYPDPIVDARLEAALRTVKLIRGEGGDDGGSGGGDGHGYGSDFGQTRHVTLDTKVETGGQNFSYGDRQLLALARALVRDTHIILIDEATSSVDPALDNHIQETIRRAFAGKTVLNIAHRIRTLIAYDKVCVMDKGRAIEFGMPRELWAREGSKFRQLCDASKILEKDFV